MSLALEKKIQQQRVEIEHLARKCGEVRHVRAQAMDMWGKPPLDDPFGFSNDFGAVIESSEKVRVALTKSAKKCKRLCMRYLRGQKPSIEIICLNIRCGIIGYLCEVCDLDDPHCALCELDFKLLKKKTSSE